MAGAYLGSRAGDYRGAVSGSGNAIADRVALGRRGASAGAIGAAALAALHLGWLVLLVADVSPRSSVGVTIAYAAVLATVAVGALVAARIERPAVAAVAVVGSIAVRVIVAWSLVAAPRDDPMNPWYLLGPSPWLILVAEAVIVIGTLGVALGSGTGIGRWVVSGLATVGFVVVGLTAALALIVTPIVADRLEGGHGDDRELWSVVHSGNGGKTCRWYRVVGVLPGLVVREDGEHSSACGS